MAVALVPAYLLHRRPYRESSWLLEAFSRDHGRVGLIARGVGRPGSPRRGLLQPFLPLLLSWSGRGELATLTAIESESRPRALSPARLLSGLYLNELLLRLLVRQDPHPGLFEAYRQALAGLADAADEEAVLRRFELRLLAELGYALTLTHELRSGRPLRPQQHYRYHPETGATPVTGAGEGIIISGHSLLALSRDELHEPSVRRDAKRLLRGALNLRLERPLHSRRLLAALRRRFTAESEEPRDEAN
ncbi:MAG: DNA repair protein RecO [Candidatus Competibacterales bacterium]|nr:DNA repair protein RecO [Candidatus Competibacterales bacterium]